MAEQTLHLGEFHTMEYAEKQIRSITEDEVLATVNRLLSTAKYSIAVVEPKSKKKTVLDVDLF
jgi:predicted Zn-dependent peptidase